MTRRRAVALFQIWRRRGFAPPQCEAPLPQSIIATAATSLSGSPEETATPAT